MKRKPLIVTMSGPPRVLLCRLLRIPPGQLEELYDFASIAEPRKGQEEKRRTGAAYQIRADAWSLICSHRWRGASRVVLLGRELSYHFGLRTSDAPLRWVEWGHWEGRRVAVLPHPGTAAEWWRKPGNEERARRFLRELAGLSPDDPQGRLEVVAED